MSYLAKTSSTSYRLTLEQQDACASDCESMKISAFAGTGKTSTLVAYSAMRPLKRILYLAFNRPIAEEAKQKFPSNVVCKTTHGLAFEEIGALYFEAGKLGESRTDQVAKFLGCSAIQALGVKKTVNSFMSSGAQIIGVEHVDKNLAERGGAKSQSDLTWFVEQAKKLWFAMCDPTDTNILLPHDGYLKMFVASAPKLYRDYDVILMDEAQDSSGAVSKLVMEQSCQRVLVGDKHQAIYSWRGAINAMERYECEREFSLTTSFRYGPEIAEVANQILASKGETRRVIGAGKPSEKPGTPAVLCRTNASVLSSSMTLAAHGKSVFFIGGPESYRFKKIIDAYHLAFGNRGDIQDPFYGSFASFEALEHYAKEAEDIECKQVCKIVKTYGSKTIKMAQMATDNAVRSMEHATVILGTAHKSKGMEFGVVALEEDFVDLANPDSGDKRNMEEETNLIYVASTRAKSKLYPSKKLTKWLYK